MGKKLTDSVVRSLRCPEGKASITITDVGGALSIYVSKTAKIWRYRYRFAGKLQSPITIGPWPAVDYETAKTKVAAFEELKRDGKDPRYSLNDPRKAVRVVDVLEYHLSKMTNAETRRNATSVYKPLRAAYGNTLVSDFNRKVLLNWIDENYGHKPGAARTLLRYLTAAFNIAADTELSGLTMPEGFTNPAAKLASKSAILRSHQPGSHARAFEPDDVAKMFKGIEAAYRDPTIYPPGVMVLHLLLLTGARPSEITTLKWSEIETVEGVTRIVKAAHKTWKRTGRPRWILVMAEGRKVLERAKLHIKKIGYKGPYVFPQRRAQENQKRPHVHQIGHYADRVGKLAGVDFVPYNLRSGYINFALDTLGFEHLEQVAENVGHTNVQTTLTFYRRQRDSKLVEAAKKVDEAFASIPDAA